MISCSSVTAHVTGGCVLCTSVTVRVAEGL